MHSTRKESQGRGAYSSFARPYSFPLLQELVYKAGLRRLEYRREASQRTRLPLLEGEPEQLVSPEARRLVDVVGPERCLAVLMVPLREEADGSLTVLVADPTSDGPETVIEETLGPRHLNKIVGSDIDVLRLITALRRDLLLEQAVEFLARTAPELSATTVMGRKQRWALALFLVALMVSAVVWPMPVAMVLLLLFNFLFAANVLFRVTVGIAGLVAQRKAPKPLPASERSDWPFYSVLVPMYKEPPHVVRSLVQAIERLDYPKEKLDVIFLLEEDDQLTVASCKEASPPGYVRLITVPPSLPRTKPKALNWGLLFAHGEYLTIYDAEDQPEPDQLKKAVLRFEMSRGLACLQAALNFYNARRNLLTRLFALEYSTWFDNLIPGLRAWGLAFPLGGTSNHFRTVALKEAGAWDPFNVTEDADLGFRLQRLGYRVSFLPSTTYEEASSRLHQWLRQRSRWIKGYMITWLVHGRRPFRLLREVGFRAWLSFHLLIGGTPLAFLAHLPLALLTALSFFVPAITDPLFPSWIRLPYLGIWVGGLVAAVSTSAIGVIERRWWDLLPFSLLTPLYWFLHSSAAWWALYELIFRPYYWQRTPHGYHLPVDGA